MIKLNWFNRVCNFAQPDLDGRSKSQLVALLSEPNEVLPFIVTHGRGFSDWPLSLAALRAAAHGLLKPTRMRPTENGNDRKVSPHRQQLHDQMRSLIVASDVHWRPDWEERGPRVEDVLTLIKSTRIDERSGSDTPGMFINMD